MKIAKITPVGKRKVYDLSVEEVQHYVLENKVVTHNTGIYYSADTIWILGRQQEKDSDGISGYHFIINVEKSRYVKEKSKIPITVSYEGGIKKWSGLLDLAIEGEYVVKPSNGWYQLVDRTTGEAVGNKMRAADIEDNGAIWKQILSTTDFAEFIKNKYMLTTGSLVRQDDIEEDNE